MPGNLQTESYTRAMFLGRGSFPDHQDMEDTVRVRRDRQALLPNVDIQLIPFDTLSYEPLNYDFIVLRFDHDTAADIVYVEMSDVGFCLDKPETVPRYAERTAHCAVTVREPGWVCDYE